MSFTIEGTKREINGIVARYLKCDGCLPEADDHLNNLQRELIQLYQDCYGEVWLGQLWVYGETPKDQPPLVKWDGSKVLNFGCTFVVPHYDEELAKFIVHLRQVAYDPSVIQAGVKEVFAHITKLGGEHLVWT